MARIDATGVHPTLVALAAISIGVALQINDGFYDASALGWLIFAAVLTMLALSARATRSLDGLRSERILVAALGAGVLGGLMVLGRAAPGYYLPPPTAFNHPPLLVGVAAAALCTVAIILGRAVRAAFLAALVVYVGLGTWMIHASPNPQIDVMTVHKAGIDAFMNGDSPYSTSFENIYERQDQFYAPEVLSNGRVNFGVPYPPLSFMMAVPGQLLAGDIRYAELVALVIGAALIGFVQAGRVAPLAALLLLFTPRTLFVLEQGWTESLAICWLGATIYAASRSSSALPYMLGLLLAVKQYLVVALPIAVFVGPAELDRKSTARWVAKTLLVASAVTLPFVIWDPTGFARSVVWLQMIEPFRLDSLSILSALSRAGWRIDGLTLTMAPIVALAAGLALTWWLAPRSPSGLAAGIGLVLLLTFLFGKKAFCNYYFFVIAALSAAVAAEGCKARGRVV